MLYAAKYIPTLVPMKGGRFMLVFEKKWKPVQYFDQVMFTTPKAEELCFC